MTRKTAYILGAFLALIIITSAPIRTPSEDTVVISNGATLAAVSEDFKDKRIVRSKLMLRGLVTLFGGGKGVRAGEYALKKGEGTPAIALRISRGIYGVSPLKVTVREGLTVAEMANVFSGTFENFDEGEFLRLAEGKEGYLFPDTYFLLPSVGAGEVVRAMEENFQDKIEPLSRQIEESRRPLSDIVIMASIIEEEARTSEDKRIVSGILWKRIGIDMPLQVDAPFVYIIGKSSAELSIEDLENDSPYNTYTRMGLPAGPISNPGLDSIKATLEPTDTVYFYYLSDSDGKIHYATNFEQHKENKERYLR